MEPNVNPSQVQATNDASIVSKCSMVNKHYFEDKFTEEFVKKKTKRAPLINLGYFTRAVIIDRILRSFLSWTDGCKQIISLGCGFDSTYFRLQKSNLLDNCLYIEIDYLKIIKRKLDIIKNSEKLSQFVDSCDSSIDNLFVLNKNYVLLACDLRDIKLLNKLLENSQVSFETSTIFVSECVITYMYKSNSDYLIKWCSEKFMNSAFLNYEQICPEDGFGRVMMSHFDKLKSPLLSVLDYRDCKSHRNRFLQQGWHECLAASEWDWLNEAEMLQAFKRELFDEWEELHMKCCHYVVAVGVQNGLSDWLHQFQVQRDMISYDMSRSIEVKQMQCDQTLEVYGHCCCLSRTGRLFIFGGFGTFDSTAFHSRFKTPLAAIESDHGFLIQSLDFETANIVEGMRGACCLFTLHGMSEYIVVYGGRLSPNSPANNGQVSVFEVQNDGSLRKMNTVDISAAVPVPRHRHSLTMVVSGSDRAEFYVLAGIRTEAQEVLSDFWRLSLEKRGNEIQVQWIELSKNDSSGPCPRMSHSSVLIEETKELILTCGLSGTYTPLADIWKCSHAEDVRQWQQVKLQTSPLPRYGHTSHYLHDRLVLIGGVNNLDGRQPGVSVVYLDKLVIIDYQVLQQPERPLILANHSTVQCRTEGSVLLAIVVGGGANCFSFGTHFNNVSKLKIPLHDT